LGAATTAFPGVVGHTNTQDAVSNLLTSLGTHPGTNSVMIVGHGRRGSIFTGLDEPTPNHIGSDNKSAWDKQLGHLAHHGLTEIIFCSCYTGFGGSGSILLHNVVNAVNEAHIKASAFTGVLTITADGNVLCRAGKWTTVELGEDPHLTVVQPFEFFLVGATMDLRLIHQKEYGTISAADVSSISYYGADAKGRGPLIFLFRGSDIERFLSFINFSDPFEMEGEPLAIITAEVEIEYPLDKKMERKGFTVYSDMLLRDKTYPNTFYHASPDLAGFICSLIPLRP
jgi:hypothetical protein